MSLEAASCAVQQERVKLLIRWRLGQTAAGIESGSFAEQWPRQARQSEDQP